MDRQNIEKVRELRPSDQVSYTYKQVLSTDDYSIEKEEAQIEGVKQVIVGIRNLRTNMNVNTNKKSNLIFVTKDYKEEIEQYGKQADYHRQCVKAG